MDRIQTGKTTVKTSLNLCFYEGHVPPLPHCIKGKALTPDAFGLKLKPTASCEVLVNVSESGLQNLSIKTQKFN